MACLQSRSLNLMERTTSMRLNDDAPGRKVRRNKDGSQRVLWVARADIVKAGYVPKTVRLHYDPDDPAQAPLIAAACRKLQAEMLEWAAGRRDGKRRFDGTVSSLVRL